MTRPQGAKLSLDTYPLLSASNPLIRNQFPSLDRPAIFFDNPGGTQIARQSAERIQRTLLECNANHEGAFATSQQCDAILDEALAAMADLLNAARPEEIIRNSYPWIEVGQRLLLSEVRY